MTNWARTERDLLCDLFLEIGPDAPTLCGTWTTRDLAAHLVIRERRPDAAAGILLKPLAGYSEKVRSHVASTEWTALVAKVRSGPPIWSPTHFGAIDRLTNTVEFFVHHEDVRRAADGWEPRTLDADFETELWGTLGRSAKMFGRKSPTGLTLVDTSGSGKSVVAKTGEPGVSASGRPGELVLFMFGRQDHTRVGLVGDEADARAVMAAPFGI